jgi:hypothetical protein
MNQVPVSSPASGRWRDWLIVLAVAAGFSLWGLFIFYTVGVKWPPAWNFGTVPDVPGLSEYSTGGQQSLPTVASPYLHEQAILSPQHVMGPRQPAVNTTQEQKP